MKKVLAPWLVLCVACSAPPGRGSEHGGDGDGDDAKIGVVDLQRVVAETARGREAAQELERFGRGLMEQLEELEADLEAKAEAIEAAREDGTSEEDLAQMMAEYQEAGYRAQQVQAASQQQVDAARAQLTGPVLEDIQRIVRRIGQTEDFDLIVDKAGMAYAMPAIDLTERVIDEYDTIAAREDDEIGLDRDDDSPSSDDADDAPEDDD